MKKITLILLLSTSYIFPNINAVVSILPEKTFVKAIGGDKVNVALMVEPGNSPHNYEPKPSQMVEIAKADLYFAIDVEFEQVWLPKFKDLNNKMQIVDLADNISKIQMAEGHDEDHDKEEHDEHEHHNKHGHAHEGADPHIWTSPKNVKIIANTIYTALSKEDTVNANYYHENLDRFIKEIEKTDSQIKQIFSSLKDNRKFMVFHPSWGYFARDYDLIQLAVEVEGKEPKPKELIHLLKEAKEEKVNAIFTQPEFSDAVAKVIARELQIPVVKVSPLAPNWSENLIFMSNTIAGNN